jgi:hypothetical protein
MQSLKVVAAFVALTVSVYAQATGRITGSVVDATGAMVPGAAVKVYLQGGARPVLETSTTAEGLFHMVGVRPTAYDIAVEATGFLKSVLKEVKVDAARETSLPPIKLELPTVVQSLEVSANVQSVQTSNAEVSQTVTNEQVRRLPVLDRDPLSLIQTQAGVHYNGRASTVINGQRESYANMTLDGINIQDNFIRDGALDYSPAMLLIDEVSEITVSTSNSNAAASGGSAQVTFVAPSGGNDLHGKAYWYNRNSYFAANDWFNNQAGVDQPRLNQNQLGGGLSGPIRKDKLFFYTNYEAYRQHQQAPANRVILTAAARQGLYTYRDTAGNTRQANILTTAGVPIDPAMQALLSQIPGPEKINNYDVGDSRANLLRNTGGYRFNQQSNRIRDNVLAKVDYNLSTKHVFSGTYLWNRDNSDRPDASNDFAVVPKTSNPNNINLISSAWRWTPSARLTNELRFGFNVAPGDFPTTEKFGPYILDGMIFSNPVNTFLAQGRTTRTYNFADNAAYQRGRHSVTFGFQIQRTSTRSYDYAGTIPTYSIGMSAGNSKALTLQALPGGRNSDLNGANRLLASLAGWVTSDSQSFNITSRTSGFTPGAPLTRNYGLNEFAWYAQDSWKLSSRLTVTLGLRYVLYGSTEERDGLEIAPVLVNNNPRATLLSDATLNFIGPGTGRPLYDPGKRNFAPNVGLAWDPFGKSKTAVRAGYSISYVNDQTVLAPIPLTELNGGLTASAADFDLTQRVSTGLPKIVTPTYKVPRKFSDNYDLDSTSAGGMVDPHLRMPYVQQWSIGVQQQIGNTILEARYVGNHSTRSLRAFDYNQVNIRASGFLDDFLRARNNGFLAQAGNPSAAFVPAYNRNIAGSQVLTVFPQLYAGGQLNNGTIRQLIQSGQVGELAATYQIDGTNGAVNFFPNPNVLGADLLTNFSNSTYNALQVEVRHRAGKGLDVQANYTFSKVLSDAAGTSQSRLEHFLDLNNTKIERARADFDLTHTIKANAVYDLPFGKGHKWNWKPLDRALGGWSLSGIMTWQSGAPFSILSQRGTLNRAGNTRSDNNTAVTALTKGQLDKLLQFRMTGDGPVFTAQSVINPLDGTAVSSDGAPPFSGQVFFHPGPGTIGTLQRRMFSGPWAFNLDLGVQKKFRITERHSIEVRMESTNALNHATFFVGDQLLDSTNFGRISYMMFNPRLVQFGAYYRF